MKIYIETLGCPKNFVDSELAAGRFRAAGHEITDDISEADAVLLNTCGFINDAKKESIDRIFELHELKNEDSLLCVSGCLSQRYSEELFKEMPEIDVLVGVNDYDSLPEMVEKCRAAKTAVSAPDASDIGRGGKPPENADKRLMKASAKPCGFSEDTERVLSDKPYSAYLKIAEGCSNTCAYCIIPAIRGGYRSRKPEDVLKEARALAAAGTKELIIIAQDVTAYGTDFNGGKPCLDSLLKELCAIDGIEWIRLMYCYEDRITDGLIEVMASEPKICHYIDIPIQHSNDAILKAMRRRSTRKSITSTIKKLRKAIPDIHIRTTLIVGFPGEKAAEFDDLYDFVEEMRFERLGVFEYSKEEGTAAASMKGQVRSDVKARRKDAVMRAQLQISAEQNAAKIGSVQDVFVEGVDEEGAYIGRTRYDAPDIDNAVVFASRRPLNRGDIVRVRITDAFDYDLAGEIAD